MILRSKTSNNANIHLHKYTHIHGWMTRNWEGNLRKTEINSEAWTEKSRTGDVNKDIKRWGKTDNINRDVKKEGWNVENGRSSDKMKDTSFCCISSVVLTWEVHHVECSIFIMSLLSPQPFPWVESRTNRAQISSMIWVLWVPFEDLCPQDLRVYYATRERCSHRSIWILPEWSHGKKEKVNCIHQIHSIVNYTTWNVKKCVRYEVHISK